MQLQLGTVVGVFVAVQCLVAVVLSRAVGGVLEFPGFVWACLGLSVGTLGIEELPVILCLVLLFNLHLFDFRLHLKTDIGRRLRKIECR